MTPAMDEVYSAALHLSDTERAELAELLTASVDAPPSRLHPAWTAEIRRRVAEFDSGAASSIPLDEAMARVRAKLNSRESPHG